MKSFSFKMNLLSLFAALSMSTISATAFADVCNRVNFNSHEAVLSQVQKLLPAHETITAKDAACVLEHMHDKSAQVSVGTFLASRLENPDKLNIMLDAVKDKKTRGAITSSVKSQNHQPKADVRNDKLLKDVCKKINLTPNKKEDSVYTQIKKIVKKDSTILSSDVACIIKNQTASQQKKITQYLYDRLEDPQNYTLISKVFNNNKNRDSFEKSIKKKYSEKQLHPVPQPMPPQAGNAHQPMPMPPQPGNAHQPMPMPPQPGNAHQPMPMPPQPGNAHQPMPMPPQPGNAHQPMPIPPQPGNNLQGMPHNNGVWGNQPIIADDISSKIDYSSANKITDQLKIYLGDNLIYARDAERIISKITYSSYKKDAALFLIIRLADPENASGIFKELAWSDRNEVANTGYNHIQNNPNQPRYAAKIVTNLDSKVETSLSSTILSQVKYFIGNGQTTCSDAAALLKKTGAGEQKDVGIYLISKLSDPVNVNLLFQAVTYSSTKDALIVAAEQLNIGSVQTRRAVVLDNISEKIDYSNINSIDEQFALFLGDNYITAVDTAKILHKTPYSNVQEKVAAIAIPKLSDPENINLLISEVSTISSKKQIIDIGLNNMPSYRSRSSYANNVAKDIVSKIDFTFSSLTLSQVKLFVADRSIYARDAADILAKTAATEQSDVGVYLTQHLVDVNNVNLLLNVVSYSSAKDNIIEAASNR